MNDQENGIHASPLTARESTNVIIRRNGTRGTHSSERKYPAAFWRMSQTLPVIHHEGISREENKLGIILGMNVGAIVVIVSTAKGAGVPENEQ